MLQLYLCSPPPKRRGQGTSLSGMSTEHPMVPRSLTAQAILSPLNPPSYFLPTSFPRRCSSRRSSTNCGRTLSLFLFDSVFLKTLHNVGPQTRRRPCSGQRQGSCSPDTSDYECAASYKPTSSFRKQRLDSFIFDITVYKWNPTRYSGAGHW
jgi:hypothetical protein